MANLITLPIHHLKLDILLAKANGMNPKTWLSCGNYFPLLTWSAIESCLNKFNPESLYLRKCRYEQYYDCNYPEEVTNFNQTKTIGCVPGKKVCNSMCHSQNDLCFFIMDSTNKLYYQTSKFKIAEIYTPDDS